MVFLHRESHKSITFNNSIGIKSNGVRLVKREDAQLKETKNID
jgi:hypothetical protein